MHMLRKYLSWIFALACLVFLQVAISTLFLAGRRARTIPFFLALGPAILVGVAAVFGLAWWNIWREKRSGRLWGLLASLMNLGLPLVAILRWPQSWRRQGLILGIGVAGLVAFWRSYEPPNPKAVSQTTARLPGDGTNSLLNKSYELLIFGVSLATYFGWLRWLRRSNIAQELNDIGLCLMIMLVLILIIFFHEIGHAATGLALGMRLRGMVIGPFAWRIIDGRWKFRFSPVGLLTAEGLTSMFPTTAHFRRRNFLLVAAGGPIVSLVIGTIGLLIALNTNNSSPFQAGGFLALFAAWSLALTPLNLLPLRTRNGYSDGAQIYQLLSNGPWRDFHKVTAMVGSTLVSPSRPRDYEIDLIERAALDIQQGQQGLLLQLCTYTHYLDQDKIPQAKEALTQAEAVYHRSASNICPELHTVFVFGNAYVRHNAVAAREWWARMQAKKPTRFNVDYWRANSALLWIEGNLNDADAALKKSEDLAEKLPKAGAYEFDRYCNSLLRKALDEAKASRLVPAGPVAQ